MSRIGKKAVPVPAGVTVNLSGQNLSVKGPKGEAHLTNIEATLLAYLMQHEGEVMHPQELLVDVWQYTDSTGANTLIRAHVSNLRRKIREVNGDDASIQTIRGKGYRFVA